MLSVIFTLITAFSIFSAFKPARAAWIGETIYIKANGSIEPSNAPITTKDKKTYTLTGDIKTTGDGIVVGRNNIILDGNGHIITGTKMDVTSAGILIEERKKVTIKNFKIENFRVGIELLNSSNNIVTENMIFNNVCGIYLNFSYDNAITENSIANNEWGIIPSFSFGNRIIRNVFSKCGLLVLDSLSNTFRDNLVNGRPLVYLENARDVVVKDAGQVVLVRSKRVRVENSNLSNTTVGVQLWQSKKCIIVNNTITNNMIGIRLDDSRGNTITGNTISYNQWYGISLSGSSGNRIFLNNFINNRRQVYPDKAKNSWDDGSRGNFWSDYTGEDRDNDGIGDVPYIIDKRNVDRRPLILYEIEASSPYGTVHGSGWYMKGSKATVSVSPAVVEDSFSCYFFEGWLVDGKLVSTSPEYSFIVEKPLILTASWKKTTRVEEGTRIIGEEERLREMEEELERVKGYLSKLEEIREKGIISAYAYETLKKEYQAKIEQLENELKNIRKMQSKANNS
ncbi:MAG: NosD domain-containing protein [Thermofilaceae archaeon]